MFDNFSGKVGTTGLACLIVTVIFAVAKSSTCSDVPCTTVNRAFSCDITVATLVSLNKGTAAMLLSSINPPGIELYYHANIF